MPKKWNTARNKSYGNRGIGTIKKWYNIFYSAFLAISHFIGQIILKKFFLLSWTFLKWFKIFKMFKLCYWDKGIRWLWVALHSDWHTRIAACLSYFKDNLDPRRSPWRDNHKENSLYPLSVLWPYNLVGYSICYHTLGKCPECLIGSLQMEEFFCIVKLISAFIFLNSFKCSVVFF